MSTKKEFDMKTKISGQMFIDFDRRPKKNSKNRSVVKSFVELDPRVLLGDVPKGYESKFIAAKHLVKYMIMAESTKDVWQESTLFSDVNSENIAKYLKTQMPELDFNVNSSQSAHDLYSVLGLLSIELKSHKGYSDDFLANATIYSDFAAPTDIITDKAVKEGLLSNTIYDNVKQIPPMAVMILYVKVCPKTNKVLDWRLDGQGLLGKGEDAVKITPADVASCKAGFKYMNGDRALHNYLIGIAEDMEAGGEDGRFYRNCANGVYGSAVNFKSRKLITVKGPFDD